MTSMGMKYCKSKIPLIFQHYIQLLSTFDKLILYFSIIIKLLFIFSHWFIDFQYICIN